MMSRLVFFFIFIGYSSLFCQENNDTIEYIIVYSKNNGKWKEKIKYQYEYFDMVDSEFVYWRKEGKWISKFKNIRRHTKENKYIIKENFQWIDNSWQINSYFEASLKKKENDKLYYDLFKNYINKNKSYNKVELVDINRVNSFLSLSNFTTPIINKSKQKIKRGEKLRTYRPLSCGLSDLEIFYLTYDADYRLNFIYSYKTRYEIIYKYGIKYKSQKNISDQITIFPNPASNWINFSLPQSSIVEIFIHNSIGEQVLTKSFFGEKNIQLDISILPPGQYLLIGKLDKKKFTKSLIKN